MPTIELIGAIDGQDHYTESYVADILSSDRIQLAVGSDFIGRPETRIYGNGQDVVKIRAELNLSIEKARQWTAKVLQQEQNLAIHHPHKTWFIVRDHEHDTVLVGSICPRLLPLNIGFKSAPESSQERQRYLNILNTVFDKYLHLAKSSNVKLDEGLSNFALDKMGNVYYLDDEYYSWDNFIAFSVMLGVFIRTFDWLDEPFMQELTERLIILIDNIFQDPHCRIIIGSQLQSLFMPSEQKEQLLQKLLKGLASRPIQIRPIKRSETNGRYYAILADIHSNDTALGCVLEFYRNNDITQGIVLGDIVGYGPEPRRCIEMLQETAFEIIKGNHDHAVATNNVSRGFSSNAKTAIEWTVNELEDEHKEWLGHLPAYSQNQHWFAVHGAPIDPAFFYGYVYQMTAEENLDYLQEKDLRLCFHGHSHTSGMFARDRRRQDHFIAEERIDLTLFNHSLVCPGSVGQPRNGNPNTQCAVFDSEKQEIRFIALAYDIDSVVAKIKYHGLPDTLGQRLYTGK